MPSKEQEETYQIINEFYSLAEQLADDVEDKMDYGDYLEVLERLELIDDLIKRIMDFSEFVAKECGKGVKSGVVIEEQQKRLGGKITDLLISLYDAKKQLTNNMEKKNGGE